MNTAATTNSETQDNHIEMPGAFLSSIREQKGYSTAYVAGKLHLRVNIIELLEVDDYENMPEPVFIKGYLRAYAKLLDVPADSLLSTFNRIYSPERKIEKALWQSKKETHKGEHAIRWLTALFAVGVLISVAVWWQNNKDVQQFFPKASLAQAEETSAAIVSSKAESEIRLTDLSKMRSLLSSVNQYSPLEKDGE